MTEDHDAKIISVLAFDLSYRSVTNESYTEAVIIDMSERKGSYQLGKPHAYAIAQNLAKIEKSLSHMASGFKRIRVDAYSSRDRAQEKKKIRERIDQMRGKRND
jgi:hypothetical protein